MRAEEIRRAFLRFYEERGHHVVPSAPLIPNDPTLMFTVAGMVPFKRYLLGEEPAPYPRATSVQKCFRTENIEDVGMNVKDCTLFEMLGNFSFGDYWKREASVWAWELMTQGLRIDVDRLWVTVYESDDEAEEIWVKQIGVAPERVLRFPKEDNFWHMGVAGPCGPNTEIHIDRGPSYGPEGRPMADNEEPNERYQEIYNLVFMQYVQDEPFHVIGDLPQHGIDTGMGLERIIQILQDVPSVWDTDEIATVVAKAEQVLGMKREADDPAQRRLVEIVADHARSTAFLIADGVTPSNDGRGYVLRRVLRRALTEARLGGYSGELLAPLAATTIERFGAAYPELERNREGILEAVRREEQRFSHTLDAGLSILEQAVENADATLPGDVAFRLHDTFGFPLDITKDVADRAGLTVDLEGFERLMDEQRTRSRELTESEKKRGAAQVKLDVAPTEFLGYDRRDDEGKVVAIVRGIEPVPAAKEGEEVDVVFDRTPFYAEGGGQVGDRGTLLSGSARAEVLDTQSAGAITLHRVRVLDGELHPGLQMEQHVDPAHRVGAEQAHTATHVLHHTLRNVLGEHVRQMGSLVEPGRLRFDFSHFSGIDSDSMAEIEETVNNRVAADDAVRPFETSYREAIDTYHAMAFFEEKYGDVVRVVEIGDYSYELCGGTHVPHTGRVGFVKVLNEGSIGANIRRVEALTGIEGLKWVNTRLREAERAAELVRVGADDLVSGIERLVKTQKELEKRLEAQERSGVASAVDELVAQAREAGSGKVVVARRPENAKILRELAAALRDKLGPSIVVLGTASDGSANLVAAVSKNLGVDGREILQPAAERIGGRAGGKPDLAMGGGNRPEGLDEALAVAREQAERALS